MNDFLSNSLWTNVENKLSIEIVKFILVTRMQILGLKTNFSTVQN